MRRFWAHAAAAALTATACGTHAQEGWRPFFSITPAWQGSADLDQGGDFKAWAALVRGGTSGPIGGGHRAGVTLTYDYYDFDFSGRNTFGAGPWNIVQRLGVAVPFVFQGPNDWSFGLTPSVDWFRENGASWGDSAAYGAYVSATKTFAPDKRLGFGVGVFSRIEETSVFPIVIVDWRFNDRWRLINPLPAGPSGPAGLELDYRFDDNWSFGVGGAWRSLRFRLAENGPFPNGVGEERGVPVFFRATRSFSRDSALHLYAGALVGGELRVEDSNGDNRRSDDFDPAPLLGATFTMRF